jgi:hypothetical protein
MSNNENTNNDNNSIVIIIIIKYIDIIIIIININISINAVWEILSHNISWYLSLTINLSHEPPVMYCIIMTYSTSYCLLTNLLIRGMW